VFELKKKEMILSGFSILVMKLNNCHIIMKTAPVGLVLILPYQVGFLVRTAGAYANH
jgi:hypothetical protein